MTELKINENVQENASRLYDEAKHLREKAKGAEKALIETKKKLASLDEKLTVAKNKPDAAVRVKREKQWFEKFRFFYTSENRLCIAGRDARQNEQLFGRYLEDADLFFHADIHGAPATILKDGVNASRKEKEEVAQFSASYSSAWKIGSTTVDVYAVHKDQVTKRAESGEALAHGGFVIRGEREWFRNTTLGLALCLGKEGVLSLPLIREKKDCVKISAGSMEKGETARKVGSLLGKAASIDEILQLLPSGNSSVK